jgi:hypothetical protein
MLVQLVNFEKCHSPLRSWLSPTGTVSASQLPKNTNPTIVNSKREATQQDLIDLYST